MRREPQAFLWDAHRAALARLEFTRGKSYDEFAESVLLRSAVERQFEIIGEALSQLSKVDPKLAAKVPHLPRVIAFRNILVHGYAAIDRAKRLARGAGEFARAREGAEEIARVR
jgi:uncharacterized protein with HEPN domain